MISMCFVSRSRYVFSIATIILFSFFIQVQDAHSFSIIKGGSALYIGITNPIEWMLSSSRVWEEQHMTPQYLENDAISSTVMVSRIGHTVSDRWKGKSYLYEHDNIITSLLTLGNKNSLERLNAAYRMGCYNFPYAIFCFDYRKDTWHLVATELDAPSMLLYGFTYIVNLPQKLVNKTAYIASRGTAPSLFVLLDVVVNVVSLAVEIPCAVVGIVCGTIIAFIMHPWDSICSLLGIMYFGVLSIITAVWDLIVGVFRLISAPF